MAKNKDDVIFYAEDDLQKVQLKPNMYIQKFGPLGTFHLSKECAQNSIDEMENPNTNGNIISITYNRKSDRLKIEDDGRGIPEEGYPIDIVCTKIQSGSKFFREGGKSSGEFGVGLTVVNALSSYFKLATYRNTYVHIIEFENGKKVHDENRPLKKNEKKHGTITEFSVNEKYMGKDSSLPIDVFIEWVDLMSYQISKNIKITIDIFDGLKKEKTLKFKTKPFGQIIEKFVPDLKKTFYDPIVLSGDSFIMETITDTRVDSSDNMKVKKKDVKKDIHLDVVFTHDEHPETEYVSFCNFTKTDEHGVHVDSVEEVVCRFFQNKTKAGMTEKEKQKWDVTWNDVKYGFKMVVNLSTSAQVQFMGNAKNRIQNVDLKPILKEITSEKLEEYFSKNETKLNSICKNIKLNARARVESQKVRTATKNERMDRFDELKIENYVRCNNTGKKYKELFLVEGERSATGSVRNGRNHDTQAIYGFRGVTKNPYKCSISEILANKEWKNFVKILRTGIGQNFNIDKLYFDKIILLSDADVDGYYISEGICAFIALLMPEIITEGHLYKAFPPLYSIKGDKKGELKFINSKSDLIEEFMKKVTKNYKVYLQDSKTPLNKDELFDLLYDSMDYYDNLQDLQKYFAIDKFFIERLSNFLIINDIHKTNDIDRYFNSQKFVTSLMRYLQEKYPEVKIGKKNSLSGIVNGQFISLKINERNLRKFSIFDEIFKDYGYELKVENKKDNSKSTMSLAQFMEITYPLRPEVHQRFKGLGETDAEDMGRTTLDPNNRILVQLTMNDAKKALKTFEKLQGNKKKDMELRKKMMEEYRVDRDNLDS